MNPDDDSMREFLRRLRRANRRRLPEFRDRHGNPAHTKADGSDWSLVEWHQALVGELGEYANVQKKVRRGDYTFEEALPEIRDEMGDIVCYLDLIGLQVDPSRPLRFSDTVFSNCLSVPSYTVRLAELVGSLGTYLECPPGPDPLLSKSMISLKLDLLTNTMVSLSRHLSVNLEEATADKFNRVSKRVGSRVFL